MRTKTLIIFFAGLLLGALCRLATAQQPINVSAVLVDGSNNAVPGAYLHFDLYNCGPNYPQIMLQSATSTVASGSPVTTITATIAGAGSAFHVGDTIVETGNTYGPFNGTFTVTANGSSTVSWSLPSNVSPESGTGGFLTDQTSGGYTVVQRSFDLQQNSSGLVAGTVIANDLILCGGKVSTQWTVTPMKSGATPLNAAQRYFICSPIASGSPPCAQPTPGGTFFLATAQPAQTVPQPPGYSLVYANPTATQSIDQPLNTQFNWGGTVNFCSANVLCPGGNGTVAGGSNTQVQYNCSGVLCGAALTYTALTQGLSNVIPGSFNNSALNQYFASLVGGIPANTYQIQGQPCCTTEAITGGVKVPLGATILEGDGVVGMVTNYANSAGRTIANAVALSGHALAFGTGSAVWGLNTTVNDQPGSSNTDLIGYEADMGLGYTPSYFHGIDILVSPANGVVGTMPTIGAGSAAMEIGSALPCATVGSCSGTLQWTNGLYFAPAGILNNGNAIWIDKGCTSGSCASPPITLTGFDGSSSHETKFTASSAGVMDLDGSPVCSAGNGECTGSGVTGTGSSNTIPIWTSSTAIGNSLLTAVTSPNGLNYNLGGGLYWQLDASHLTFNSNIGGSSNVLIQNAFNPGGGNQAGGIGLQGAPTSGSACAGPAFLNGGQNGSFSIASMSAGGGCANGFGAIGGSIALQTGTGTGGNGNGQIELNDNTGNFTQSGGNATETGSLKAASFQAGGTTFTASGCSNGTLVGGATAGKMTLGANSCSVTITMGSGQTAAHGWSCSANDQTTAAGNTQLYFTTAGNTTTAVLSVPSTAGTTDVIDFHCTAY